MSWQLSFWSYPFWQVWDEISESFWFAFSWWLKKHLLMHFLAIWDFLLRFLSLDLYSIFNWIVWFVDIKFLKFFIYFENLPCVRCQVDENIFSLSTKFFSFMKSHLFNDDLSTCDISVLSRKFSPVLVHSRLFPAFSSTGFTVSRIYWDLWFPWTWFLCSVT